MPTKSPAKKPARRKPTPRPPKPAPVEAAAVESFADTQGQNRARTARIVSRLHPRLAAGWDAAQTTADNSRHWANADSLSAASAASPTVRQTLRQRSRYEAQQNNAILRGICLTLANDVIGPGPRLQLTTARKALNAKVEKEFAAWCRAVHLAEKLRTARYAEAVDGEIFVQLVDNPRHGHRVTLDLALIEADQIATPDLYQATELAVDGIQYDTHGNPTTYHKLKHHPGGDQATALAEYDSIDAAAIIHLYRADRPGQLRGIPETAPVLSTCADLRRFQAAVLAAAETAADFAAVMYSDAPAQETAEAEEYFEEIDLVKRGMLSLPGGWKMEQLRAEQPTATYEAYEAAIVRNIGRAFNMPYAIAAGDSSGHNYASGRLDFQTYDRTIGVDRQRYEIRALGRIFAAWLDEALLIPDYLPADGFAGDFAPAWHWHPRPHVDPSKVATARKTDLAAGMTSYPAEFAKGGQDWEKVQAEQAAALGLTLKQYRALLRRHLFGTEAIPGQAAPAPTKPQTEEANA